MGNRPHTPRPCQREWTRDVKKGMAKRGELGALPNYSEVLLRVTTSLKGLAVRAD
jgi:hypothetical protein